MARPSKLMPSEWDAIERRLLAGESARALGREFNLSEAGIRKRFTAHHTQSAQVRTAAEKLAVANTALAALMPLQRVVAVSLADKLRNISTSLAHAAELGAKTAHRLSALANSEVGKVDDLRPLDSVDSLRGVSALTKLANDSASIGLNLLAANRDAIRQAESDADAQPPFSESERISRISQIMAAAKQREAEDGVAHGKDLA